MTYHNGSNHNKRFDFFPLNNRYLSERKRAIGNDLETNLCFLIICFLVSELKGMRFRIGNG